MFVITEAQQLATDLRAALVAPAADAWNSLHLVTLRDSLLARVPAVLARLEHCRDDPQGGATSRAAGPDPGMIDDLNALKARPYSRLVPEHDRR